MDRRRQPGRDGAGLRLGIVAALVAVLVALIPVSATADHSRLVRWDAGPSAPSIGLIGDSTLAGVRWMERYGALERFDFVFDAESCRRTAERSCWSREDLRPPNALTTLGEHAGEWGDVLVVMSGYNDSVDGFRRGVEELVTEAARQDIGAVVWLTLRTNGVAYDDPLHRANAGTYRQANRTLYEQAASSGGRLQIADWASRSADRSEWFEYDGVHLTPEGATAVTDFIAEQVDLVLSGAAITPDPPPWQLLRDGDRGALVAAAQAALQRAGFTSVGPADGDFGPQTASAVAQFQRAHGLPPTAEIDEPTAVALGLHVIATVQPPTTAVAPSADVTATTRATPPATEPNSTRPAASEPATSEPAAVAERDDAGDAGPVDPQPGFRDVRDPASPAPVAEAAQRGTAVAGAPAERTPTPAAPTHDDPPWTLSAVVLLGLLAASVLAVPLHRRVVGRSVIVRRVVDRRRPARTATRRS